MDITQFPLSQRVTHRHSLPPGIRGMFVKLFRPGTPGGILHDRLQECENSVALRQQNQSIVVQRLGRVTP